MNSPFVFPEVRLVEASAGSGKTSALAKRYIQLLLYSSLQTPQSFKHILAITFTNKAAGEMKARIISLLKCIALGQLSPVQAADILHPLGLNADQARPLAAELMGGLIRQYHFFQVQTIDSFMNALLAGCAFKINLSARFKIKRNAADYLQLSLDKLIDQSHEQVHIKRLFEDFIRQYLFLENRSGWFPKKDLLCVLTTLFNHYNTYHRPFLTFGSGDGDAALYKKQFLKLAEELNDLLPASADKRFKTGLENFVRTHERGFDIDEVSRYFARMYPPISNPCEVTTRLSQLWQQGGLLLRAICLHEAYAVFNPYVHVFNRTMQCLEDVQTKEDVLFLGQLNKKTAELFDEGLVTVEELYYRLATRFRHYLMDEFQDTSLTQWNNLRMMVVEALSTGGTLFCVGDKKQAIYGFRGGHSHLFEEIEQELGNFNVQREVLGTNYRSHAKIVEFNNRLFDGNHLYGFLNALEQQEKLKDREVVFTPEDRGRMREVFGHGHQQVRPDLPHGAVRIEIVAGKKKEDRHPLLRQKCLDMVNDIHTRFAYKEIAILTRNNTQVQLVTQWLVEAGIYAQSERTSDVKNHWLVCELVAFLRFLHSPIENRALAEFLLGQLFPRVTGLAPAQIQDFLFASRSYKDGGQVYLYKSLRDRFPQLWQEYLEQFFNQAGIYPLYEMAVSICGKFKCLELFPETQGFIMHFLELIKRREEEGCDLESFLDYFDALENEERFIPMPSQDAVQVLTIHKAKGLEFPAVIVPFLEMPIKAGAGDRNGTQSFTWDIDEEGVRLLRLKESYTRFSEELRLRYAHEYKECLFSELNNVYVATTRAVFELHMLIPERVGNSINPAMMLVPPEMFHSGEMHAPAPSARSEARVFLPAVSYQQWLDKLQEDFLLQRPDLRKARLEGEILHFCLSQIKNLSQADITNVLAHALCKARARFSQWQEWDPMHARLRALLEMDSWRKFFYLPMDAEVLCEQDVVDRSGNGRRLDRLIILPKEIKIVDFKTSHLDKEIHQSQINDYVAIMSDLYPHKNCSGHLLYVNDIDA
jgi:ATP-dependent helicase/nuclease subunit A